MSANTLHGAWAQGSDEIRVGLIGCGGRGTGAARNVVDAAPGVRIVAMADAFKDRLDESRTILAERLGDKFAVTDETCFVGLDAYQKLLAGQRQLRDPGGAAGLPARRTSRRRSRPASTSSRRSRWPSTAPASAAASSRSRR